MQTPTTIDIILLPLLLTFMGMGAFVLYSIRIAAGPASKAPLWTSVGFLVLGSFVGARTLWEMLNPSTGAFYRAGLYGGGRFLIVAHYLGLLIPLAALVVVFATERWRKTCQQADF